MLQPASPVRVWYKSLYWRIAVGFVTLLAALLVGQAMLFLWLTDRFVASPSSRTPQQLADAVARELSGALADDASLDLEAHVRDRFADLRQPFVVIMRDGRRASNRPDVLPRGFPVAVGRGRPGPGGARRNLPDMPTADGQRRTQPDGARRPRAGGRGGPAYFSAPIVVSNAQVGFVAVPAAPPPIWLLLRELGPTLTWSGLVLLAVGAVVTAALIFRPAHKRLRSLEETARALGEGRTDVRANDAGGDEVAALARAFNRMASDLETRAGALAASDAARRQLLADVSHELMTPLTAIRGYVQTLAMPELNADEPTRQRYLDIVDQETYKLEAMIGDLLDLARLEGGGGSLAIEPVGVAELFRRIADRHGPSIRAKRLSFDVAIVPEDLAVRGDPHRLEQALQNIAANAIRHTPDGGRVELHGERRGERIRIAVRDTGPGIREEHLRHVFDRFYKADPSRAATSTQSGSGLGLSIVRAIVQRHGGTVSAVNAPGGGALFELMLPVSDFGAPSSKG
jgi:signal transduction histidine kinase